MTEEQVLKEYLDRLFPIFRSITGKGIRESMAIINEFLPLEMTEIPSGTTVLDWQVPKEWVVNEAYIECPDGRRICDIRECNLHLVNYSMPVNAVVSKSELDKHLHSIEHNQRAIPYVTSYYSPNWGFCIAHEQRKQLPEGDYKVVIDTDHVDGSLTIAEAVLSGESDKEVLFATHFCHPSMANDQLSGPLTLSLLHERLKRLKHRKLTYRFVFMPETIGSIGYLSTRGEHLRKQMIAGYVVALTGGKGPFVYRRSRIGTSIADAIAERILARDKAEVFDFRPAGGNDQRQFCSPGFDLPVGCITHTPQIKGEEYHTSLDDIDSLSLKGILASVGRCESICEALESSEMYVNLHPYGEPFLSRHGLYDTLGRSTSGKSMDEMLQAILWLLNYSDGNHDIRMIATKSGLPEGMLQQAVAQCLKTNLIEKLF